MITKGTILFLLVLGLCHDGSYSMSHIDRAFQALQDDFEQIRSTTSYGPNRASNSTSAQQRSVVEDQKPTSRTDNSPNYFIPELFLRSGIRDRNFFPPNGQSSFRHNTPTRATIHLRNVPERGVRGFNQPNNNAIRIIPLDSRGRSLDENAVFGFIQPERQLNFTQSPPRTDDGRPYIIQHRKIPPHITPFSNNGPTRFINPNFMYNSGGYAPQGQDNQGSKPEYNRGMTNSDSNDEERGYMFVSPETPTTEIRPDGTLSENPQNDDSSQENVAEVIIPVPVSPNNRRPQENSDKPNEDVEIAYETLPIPQPRPRPSPNSTSSDSPIGYIRFPPPPSLSVVTNRNRNNGQQNLYENFRQKDEHGYGSYENPYPNVPNPFFTQQNNSSNTNPTPFVPWYQNNNPFYNNNGTNPFVPHYPFSKNSTIPGAFYNLPFPSNSTGYQLPIYTPSPNFFNPFNNNGHNYYNDTAWNANNFSTFLKPPPGFFDNPFSNNSQTNYGFIPFSSNSTLSSGPDYPERNYPQPVYPGPKVYDHGQPYYPNHQGGSENETTPGKTGGYDYEYPIHSPPLKNTSYSYDEESYHRLPPDLPVSGIPPAFIPAVPDYKPYDFEKARPWNDSELERETDRRPQNQDLEGDYRPLASTIASQSSSDKNLSLNLDRPWCAKEGDSNFCITDPDYPRKLIESAMLENESMAKLLYKDISIKDYYAATAIPPTDDLLDNRKQGGVLNPRLDTELNRKSIRKIEEEDSQYRCASVVHYAKPTRARNLHGEWKVIVNLDKNMEQIARLEVCTNVNSECIYTGKKVESKCFQKQDKFKLLSWNRARGLHTDMFYLPVACSCFVGNTLT